MLIGISTPYRRSGLLYQKHRDHFGVDDDDVLVVNGTSRQFNGTLDEKTIARAVTADPEAARAEWEGEFRSDVSAFLDDDTIDGAINHDRPLELPPQSSNRYVGFVDVSGGRHDAYTICIAHKSGNEIVADVVRGAKAPLNPQMATRVYAELLKVYHVREVVSDAYAGEWVTGEFRAHGIVHKRSERNKSELYLECLPWFMRGAIRVGRDMVDAPRGISEDHANALAGAVVSVATTKGPIIIPKGLIAKVEQMGRAKRLGFGLSCRIGRGIEY
jgi:hypothetical protein